MATHPLPSLIAYAKALYNPSMAAPLARDQDPSLTARPAPPRGVVWTAQVMSAAARAMGRLTEAGRCDPASALDWLGRLEDAGRLMTIHAALTPWLSRYSTHRTLRRSLIAHLPINHLRRATR